MTGGDPRQYLYAGDLTPDEARRLAARHLGRP